MTHLTCPRCTGPIAMTLAPALSRTDNKTPICSACGRVEGLRAWRGEPLPPQEEWPIRPA